MAALLIAIVEDTPSKADCIERCLRYHAKRHSMLVEVERFGTVFAVIDALGNREDCPWDAIVTDWELPIADEYGPHPEGGSCVVTYARDLGVPYCVFSGAPRPEDWREPPDATTWATDWMDAAERLLLRAANVQLGAV